MHVNWIQIHLPGGGDGPHRVGRPGGHQTARVEGVAARLDVSQLPRQQRHQRHRVILKLALLNVHY